MTPPALRYPWVVFRRWMMLVSAIGVGLALVALLVAGQRAGAAAPNTLAPPSASMPDPARLAPTAQISLSTCPREVVVVMDRSGSMDYDTICFNCYRRTEPDEISNPDYTQYPQNGVRYPVPEVANSNLCLANAGDAVAPILYNGAHYQILEAELYSLNSSTWERSFRTTGQGYWAINRRWTDTWKVPRPIDPISGTQTAPGAVSHQPYVTFIDNTPSSPLFGRFYYLEDAESGIAPRLQYDFALPDTWNGNTVYIWLRGRQYDGFYPAYSDELDGTNNPDVIYWAVNNGTPIKADDTQGNGVGQSWTWIRLGSVSGLATHSGPGYIWHTLKIWAGSPGYTIDRIIITDDSGSSLPSKIRSDPSEACPQDAPCNGDQQNWTTPGSARRQACDPCNPIFGLNITDPRRQDEGGQCAGYYNLYGPTDNLRNDLFSDNQPIRGAKEAVKNLVRRLRPDTDQVGLVTYNNTATKGSELMCMRRYGVDCYTGTAPWGWPGGPTPYTYTLILNSIEDQWASSGTCTACGLRAGLEELGINVDDRPGVDNKCDGSPDSACAYGVAKRMMILLTDGVPNVSPGGPCDDDPELWPDGGAAHDCGIYYAKKAAERGVVIYVIGLGNGVDIPWLQAIAQETKGQFYQSSSPNDLNMVFDDILSRTGAACLAPNLVLTKSVAPSQGLGAGDILTYSLSFSNTGDLPSPDVVLTDRLPLNTQFITASGSFTPPAPMPGDVIRWNFSELRGGVTGTQQLTLVISPTQPGQVLTNIAGMSGRSIYGYYISAQALLATSFGLPPGDGPHLYLPIILRR